MTGVPPSGSGSRPSGGAATASPAKPSIPNAIIFLDFDGVICSPRAFTAQADRWSDGQRALRWADQVACDMVARLLKKHSAQLVISSTWRFMLDDCHKVLGRYDLTPFLHDDWRTGEDLERLRGNEVATWLEANNSPPFIILDDDNDFSPAQQPWLVQTCSLNGLMLHDFDKADKLLASAMSAGTAATTQIGAGLQPASAVGEAETPNPSPARGEQGQ